MLKRLKELKSDFHIEKWGSEENFAGRWTWGLGRDSDDRWWIGLHVLLTREHWQWGYQKEWYDGPLWSFGFGPFFLICIS